MNRNTHRYSPRQEASLLSWFFFGGALVLSWLTGVGEAAPWLPFLISIVFFGLSHGAADWLLLKPSSKRSGASAFFLYSLIGLAIGILAWLFPLGIIAGFFILTVIHFGMNDERDLRSHDSPRSLPRTACYNGVVRMGAFLSLVCFADPAGVAGLFGRVAVLFGAEGEVFFETTLFGKVSGIFALFASAVWIGFVCVRAVHSLRTPQDQRGHRIGVELFEMSVLVACALTLPSVYAVGLYFLCWHAFRHTIVVGRKLMETEGGTLGGKVAMLHLRSWPLSLPVLPLMLWLIWANGSLSSPIDWVAAFLVVCIVFTLPHHLIVERTLGNETHAESAFLSRRKPEGGEVRRKTSHIVEREETSGTPIFL